MSDPCRCHAAQRIGTLRSRILFQLRRLEAGLTEQAAAIARIRQELEQAAPQTAHDALTSGNPGGTEHD